MNNPFEYTLYPDSRMGYEAIGIALRENKNNLPWEKLNESQRNLADRLAENPHRFIVKYNDYFLLHEMAALTSKMWEQNKCLTVYFDTTDDQLIDRVFTVATEWSCYCNITFKKVNDRDASDIRVSFLEKGHYSCIGVDAKLVPKSQPTMNFELNNVDIKTEYFSGIILHEFGHALGLIHEHQSPTVPMKWRKDYIYWKFYSAYGWSKDKVDQNLFREFEKEHTMYSALDTKSIMAYHIPKDFTEDGIEFPQNTSLSEMDKKYIGELYPKTTILKS